MALTEMLMKTDWWKNVYLKNQDDQKRHEIRLDMICAIRTPWLKEYRDSSRGKADTLQFIKKIANIDDKPFRCIDRTPFNIEKYVKERE